MALERPTDFRPEVLNNIAKTWAAGTRQKILIELMKLPLPDKARLFRKVQTKLKKQFGEVNRISYEYFFYGFFWDFGSENLFGNPDLQIPAFNWKAKAINPRIDELADKVAEYFGDTTLTSLKIK